MKIDDIKELIRTLDQSDVAELTWESEGARLVLRKAVTGQVVSALVQNSAGTAASSVQANQGAEQAAAEGKDQDAADDDANLVTIVAPMVGTFYRAPAPDAEPYVEVGDIVETGDPVCIIEAMKLMNEIESDTRGRVKQILVENGQPVEYGQALFTLEKL